MRTDAGQILMNFSFSEFICLKTGGRGLILSVKTGQNQERQWGRVF